MDKLHEAYLNLGSNIQPHINLVKAIRLLFKCGEIRRVSNAWESKSVGAAGPNYLNACVFFISSMKQDKLKEEVIRPIEARLGRERSENRYIPRTIDIDIILFDDAPCIDEFWNTAFVVAPLAEIYPEYQNPTTGEKITEIATRLRQIVWLEAHPEVLGEFSGSSFNI